MASRTELYTINGEKPRILPDRIRLTDGTTRTDVGSYTEAEVADAGYEGPISVPEEIKDYDPEIKYVEWNSTTKVYDIKEYTDEFLLNRMRISRDRYLAWTDHQLLSDAGFTESQVTQIKTYRQALRDMPTTVDPKNVTWPTHPCGSDNDPRALHLAGKIQF